MKKKGIIIVGILSAIILALGAWQLVKVYEYTSTHFPENTKINGIDCSGLTAEEAALHLTSEWNKKSIEITENNQVVGNLSVFDYEYNIKEALDEEISPTIIKPVFDDFFKKGNNVTIPMVVKEETESFKTQFNQFAFLEKPYKTKTVNAYVDMSNTDFKIVKEIYGDNIDKNRFKVKLLEAVAKGDKKIEFIPKESYEKPTVKSDDKGLLKEQQYCKDYLSLKIEYKLSEGKVRVTPTELNKMLRVDDKGTVSVVQEEVANYIEDLSNNVNTVGMSRMVKTTLDGVLKVPGGNYGYLVNQGEEAKLLTENIKAGKDVTREPVYSKRPYSMDANEIGNSYVEIDISSQKVWLYKNGKSVLSSDIVTGNVKMGSSTPTGIYGLAYKERDTVLKGRNYDGTKYASPVKYWMPFNGDIGMHDASWRKTFGGKYYLTEGSKGCVNLPTNVAQAMYNSIEPNFPIILHY